ncbi:MAG: hypothetical protein P8P91_02235 [Pseudomonadales bacterium]|jgi:hypothetical protein|nr:hypothetical protein [Gammaproteobacteria bacterium]MDG1231056.1 hypothetical protein [Pseudomonadales bacterium]
MRPNLVSWLNTASRTFIITAMAGFAQFAYADSEHAATWGPSIGATAPLLSALDQDGQQQDLESLSGTNGLLFVFNRSVDW